jgi:hypothetical protein
MNYELDKQIVKVIKTYSPKNAEDILGAWARTLLTDEQGKWLLEFAEKQAKEEGVA